MMPMPALSHRLINAKTKQKYNKHQIHYKKYSLILNMLTRKWISLAWMLCYRCFRITSKPFGACSKWCFLPMIYSLGWYQQIGRPVQRQAWKILEQKCVPPSLLSRKVTGTAHQTQKMTLDQTECCWIGLWDKLTVPSFWTVLHGSGGQMLKLGYWAPQFLYCLGLMGEQIRWIEKEWESHYVVAIWTKKRLWSTMAVSTLLA